MVEIGIKGRQDEIVTEELTASHIGSGAVRVFATPMMISLMEKTCQRSVVPYLEEGQETVGTRVDIAHVSSTPIGMKVWCESELVDIDRRRLVFKVAAYDEKGLIGEGRHERFIIDIARFKEKTESKLQ
jgi:fluoroacetyl-CoA thioesterase